MAVQLIYSRPDGTAILTCLAADTKPTNYPAGSILYVVDDGAEEKYEFNSVKWLKVGSLTSGGESAELVNIGDPLPELGIEAIDASQLISPVAGVNLPIYTVPAGCYTLKIQSINNTGGGFTALSIVCAYRINGVATMSGEHPLIQPGSEPFYLGVNPGDEFNVIGGTGTAGSLQVTGMG